MDKELFYLGILAGITFMQGVMSWEIREMKKPYITAFAWLMFWESMIVVCEGGLYIAFGKQIPDPVSSALDYFVMPIFYIEVLCLAYQDMTTFSWTKRCLQAGALSIPLVINLVVIIATGQKETTTWMHIFGAAYVGVVFVLAFYHLRRFHNMLVVLKEQKRKEEKDVTWVIPIIILTVLQYIIYMVFNLLPDIIIYYIVSYLIIGLHGHYIRKQAPTNMKKLYAMNEEIMEQQQEAIDELKNVTEGFRKKIDMDTAIKAFRMLHPSFDTRLRKMTETKLTKRDIILCCMIYDGKKIPEIADYLGISPASVEVARHRLRTKLNIEKGVNMNKVLLDVIG